MLINRDAMVPFGIEAPRDHRKRNIQRHKLYLEIQDGRRRPPYHSPETFCLRNYYDTCFLGNWMPVNIFSALFFLFGCV